MKAKAYTTAGEARPGEVDLPGDLFDGTVNEAALHQVVTAIRAAGRQGTHATKTRNTVRGGSRKPWRQKGTGRARQGSIRAAQWRGGAIAFGPLPRDYGKDVPKRLRRLAIRSALNARALEGALVITEPFALDEPRTKAIVAFLEGVEAEGNVLVLTDGLKREVYLSGRNVPGVMVKPWGEASAYDVLWADLVVIEESALAAGEEEA